MLKHKTRGVHHPYYKQTEGLEARRMHERPDIQDLTNFLIDYATTMIGVGTYTSRVVRCTQRIAHTYGYDANISFLFNHTYITVIDIEDHSLQRTCIADNKALGVNFRTILELSALSWSIFDHAYSISYARRYYEHAIHIGKNNVYLNILFASIANGAFCEVFGGDMAAIALVFVATLFGASLRAIGVAWRVDIRFIYIICSFVSSLIAAFGAGVSMTQTPASALGASTLYLVPGVFFINAIIDVLKNNILMGLSRVVSVSILIACIAIGVYATLELSALYYH